MRLALFVLLAACTTDVAKQPADMTFMVYPKEGQPCGSDGGAIDPNACGAGYVCMKVGSLDPTCLVVSGQGGSCGGNTSRPRQCPSGLVCKSNGIPDAGGTCQTP